MKIATWNVERLKHKKYLRKIVSECESINADILVLTETDTQIYPHYKYYCATPSLSEIQPDYYKTTENRVSIFSNYKILRLYDTYDKYTSICAEIETERGNLLVYGTIIGIFGNRHPSFKPDLQRQLDDFKRLSSTGNLCICGDYNCGFSDNYYFTKYGRIAILQTFSESGIQLLTKDRSECIDHIAISSKFIHNQPVQINEWNYSKSLSDHKGISIKIG